MTKTQCQCLNEAARTAYLGRKDHRSRWWWSSSTHHPRVQDYHPFLSVLRLYDANESITHDREKRSTGRIPGWFKIVIVKFHRNGVVFFIPVWMIDRHWYKKRSMTHTLGNLNPVHPVIFFTNFIIVAMGTVGPFSVYASFPRCDWLSVLVVRSDVISFEILSQSQERREMWPDPPDCRF